MSEDSTNFQSQMPILFLSGNAGKLREVQAFLPEVQSWDVDLPEIQSADARLVIEAKLLEAVRLKPGRRLLVDDTSLYLDALAGLPGPLIKWFIAPGSIGLTELAELAAKRGQTGAQATTWSGYLAPTPTGFSLHFFEGTVKGQIVQPRGNQGFGWDPLFQPEGSDKTFGEMTASEKASYSMRSLALAQLKVFLSLPPV